MAMVQRKIGIYNKYLPMIATFVTELSDVKKLPKYKSLLDKSEDKDENKIIDVKEDEPKIVADDKKVILSENVLDYEKDGVNKSAKQTTIEDFK